MFFTVDSNTFSKTGPLSFSGFFHMVSVFHKNCLTLSLGVTIFKYQPLQRFFLIHSTLFITYICHLSHLLLLIKVLRVKVTAHALSGKGLFSGLFEHVTRHIWWRHLVRLLWRASCSRTWEILIWQHAWTEIWVNAYLKISWIYCSLANYLALWHTSCITINMLLTH